MTGTDIDVRVRNGDHREQMINCATRRLPQVTFNLPIWIHQRRMEAPSSGSILNLIRIDLCRERASDLANERGQLA
jgi:hypothetical protein